MVRPERAATRIAGGRGKRSTAWNDASILTERPAAGPKILVCDFTCYVAYLLLLHALDGKRL
jgi:hypothetical protein